MLRLSLFTTSILNFSRYLHPVVICCDLNTAEFVQPTERAGVSWFEARPSETAVRWHYTCVRLLPLEVALPFWYRSYTADRNRTDGKEPESKLYWHNGAVPLLAKHYWISTHSVMAIPLPVLPLPNGTKPVPILYRHVYWVYTLICSLNRLEVPIMTFMHAVPWNL